MTKTATLSASRRDTLIRIAAALTIAAAAALTTAAPGIGHAEEPRAAQSLKTRAQPPLPGKEVFVRTKPHVNVAPMPTHPSGPGGLAAQHTQQADWYCGEGAGPGGHAICTKDLIASCSGTYVPPGTNGPQQTWGMCHEKS